MTNQHKRKKFNQIYDQHINKIYRFVYLKVSSQEIAQDICSEAFLRCWRVFQKNQEEIDNFQSFLYQIARNLVIDFYRKKGRTETLPIESCLEKEDPKVQIERDAFLKADIEEIKKALTQIKDDYQNVIIWHYLDDLSISECAKILDRTESATRVLLHRALKALKEKILK